MCTYLRMYVYNVVVYFRKYESTIVPRYEIDTVLSYESTKVLPDFRI